MSDIKGEAAKVGVVLCKHGELNSVINFNFLPFFFSFFSVYLAPSQNENKMFSKDRSKASTQWTVLPTVSEGKRIYLLVKIISISSSVVTNTSKIKCVEWALYPEKAERAIDKQMKT